jgi:hypothetical protein
VRFKVSLRDKSSFWQDDRGLIVNGYLQTVAPCPQSALVMLKSEA